MATSANTWILHYHPVSFFTNRTPILFGSSRSQHFVLSRRSRVLDSCLRSGRTEIYSSFCCLCKANSQIEEVEAVVDTERPPFDINLAVVLAGFAFEAYTTPPENVGRREIDAAGCMTVYLSESFVREIYDGQLFIKLKKGSNFPAMDPWGTSDPYVVMQLGGQVVKSKIKLGTKDPTWNEEFSMNIKLPPSTHLQVAAWDANLVTPHKRMGNAGIDLDKLCDGDLHELLVELEGMGGGGKIHLEVKYRSFGEIEEDKKWWKIPFVSEFLRKNGVDSAIKMLLGSETVPARQFVEYAFGQIRSLNDSYLQKDWISKIVKHDMLDKTKSIEPSPDVDASLVPEKSSEGSSSDPQCNNGAKEAQIGDTATNNESISAIMKQVGETAQSNKHFWKRFADAITQNVVQKLGGSVPERMKWDGFDLLNKMGQQSQRAADAGYVESGLASPRSEDNTNDKDTESGLVSIGKIPSSLPDIKKATEDILRQTDAVLSGLMVLAASVPQLKKELQDKENTQFEESDADISNYLKSDVLVGLDGKRAEEMKGLFLTAESAMEAWAMLATSLGHPSFVKSEFEKICFLDNSSTDTQVAIWRDSFRKRLVVAFRGTEQSRWKDLRTDLMLAPTGLNPERIGSDFKQEVQVHSGFLSAYDSVRTRIMSLIRQAVGYLDDDDVEPQSRWHVYCTGHSLGGALATLLALELSSSQLAKHGVSSVTMYNFGSPRVGNRRFAEVYNERVKDSWRVVNHRDIIPTVPRLMGYCHVAQPVYLTAGGVNNALVNMELMEDGYQGDVIGEATPDLLVDEFMKGEKELIDRLLQTEINIFRAIRDGSALMQHMEDFYYISLLENVRSNYQAASLPQSREKDDLSVG